jgi:hypothetical protein
MRVCCSDATNIYNAVGERRGTDGDSETVEATPAGVGGWERVLDDVIDRHLCPHDTSLRV